MYQVLISLEYLKKEIRYAIVLVGKQGSAERQTAMQTINVGGKQVKVKGYAEYTYTGALKMLADNKYNVKMFGWSVASDAKQDTSSKAFSVWENGSDWGCVLKFQSLIMAYKGTSKRPKMVRFAFTRNDVYLVDSTGKVIL